MREQFGPFHRLESPTQTAEDAARQEDSCEMWGRVGRYELTPKVKAYDGPLPENARGVEFMTSVEPDLATPPGRVSWRAGRDGVKLDGEFAQIPATITKNRQK